MNFLAALNSFTLETDPNGHVYVALLIPIVLSHIEDTEPKNAVANITTLALALCGGVLLIALAACGLVLCAQDHPSSDLARTNKPPLCAYNTEGTKTWLTINDLDHKSA